MQAHHGPLRARSEFASVPRGVREPRIVTVGENPTRFRAPEGLLRARRELLVRRDLKRYVQTDVGRSSLARLDTLRNSQAGEMGMIVCSGPSLATTPLEDWGDRPSIIMNRGYLISGRLQRPPEFLCAHDETVIRNYGLEMATFVESQLRTTLVVPKSSLGCVGGPERVVGMTWDKSWEFATNLRLTVHHGYTVTFWALQLAFLLGWSTTVIVGLDHRFNNASERAGESRLSVGSDANHFTPAYFGAGVRVNSPVPKANEYSYMLARSAFEGAGREVLDCTPRGACTIFRRATFRELSD